EDQMTGEELPPLCRQVWERAVESTFGNDVMTDAALAAHVGSCVTCFRTLAELRDASRLAAALRADAAPPPAAVGRRLWADLASRPRAAGAAARAAGGGRKRRVVRVTGFAAVVAAAAAAFVLVAGRGHVQPPLSGPGSPPPVVATAASGEDDEGVVED